MDFIWILFAFACGLAAKTITLPPSIGYLVAGFILHFLGFQADSMVRELANLGITLMLFTIGLKLNIKELFKTEVWAGSISHNIIWLVIGIFILKIIALTTIPFISNLTITTSAIIVFALSFSSTVCVVKLMEDHGEMRTRHGKLAVGVLVMQDIIAVIFLVLATGKTPSPWASLLLLAIPLRPVLTHLLNKVGHGELIPLTGFFIAFGAYELFEFLSIKGDLGALIAGMYLASHSKASEINKSLLNFKDLFLIGFFLSIGFTALPTWEMLGIASLITLMIPIKFLLFFALFIKLKLRGRTAFLAALALANFSEFGLIITSISVNYNWLSKEWLVILSLAVSISFIFTNILYNVAHSFFAKHKDKLKRYEHPDKLKEDVFIQPCDAPIIIIGMGRVGMGAYKALDSQSSKQAWGLDTDRNKVDWLNNNDTQAFCGDAEDADFWENIELSKIQLVLLALPSIQDITNITKQLRYANYQGKIAAIARFDDERLLLEKLGVDKVFNFYNEAGVGFAEESINLIMKTD
ncbi:MAG: cation:proton antiporter [Colwelliaceae bacterium]|nr:cation:proton antiporter [Colwelliaceae bacterium]